jgi:hypothetical protein
MLSDKRLRPGLDDLLLRQSGVARRDQLSATSVSWDEVEAQLVGRRWQTIGPLVIVVHNGPLTPIQRQWAAVLHCGKTAALAARTASAAGGLDGWDSSEIEVLVPRGTTVVDCAPLPLVVHESRRFAACDIHPAAAPPRTRIERSLIDAATWSASPRAAAGVLCAGVQQRLTTASRLRRELESAGRIRFRALLDRTIDDIEGGSRALSEIDFVRMCRRWRLPVTARQQVRRDRWGRRRYLDVVLTGPSGQMVRAEIDGALHLLVRNYWDDMFRQNELTIAGSPVLRFSSVAVRIDERAVVDQLARALKLPSPLAELSGRGRGRGR